MIIESPIVLKALLISKLFILLLVEKVVEFVTVVVDVLVAVLALVVVYPEGTKAIN